MGTQFNKPQKFCSLPASKALDWRTLFFPVYRFKVAGYEGTINVIQKARKRITVTDSHANCNSEMSCCQIQMIYLDVYNGIIR
jgi:hypothetical protein